MGTIDQDNKLYYTVVGGKIRRKVDEGTERAKLREGVLKDGSTYSKWELVHSGLSGLIKNVKFWDGKFGKSVVIFFEDEGEGEMVLTLGADNRNTGVPFMQVLPNLDLSKPVTFKPYDFEDDGGKRVSGLSIQQDGEKIKSYFYDPVTKKSIHGVPEPKKNKKGETNWKVYYAERDEWLQEYMVENNFIEDADAPVNAPEEDEGEKKDEEDF